MAIGRGRRERGGIEAWPGYVDALSTLLMVLIFVLLVFVLAQGFLSVALSSRDRALDRLNRQVAELGELLALERGQAEELRGSLGRTTEELRTATAARDAAQRSLSLLRDERDRLATERDTTRGERDRLAARIADLEAATRGSASRVADLEARLAEALARAEAVGGDAARTAGTLADAQRQLAGERQQREAAQRDLASTREALEAARRDLAAMREEAAKLDRTVQADRETIEARLSDIAKLNDQVRALEALRDQLERQAQQALARASEEERQRTAAQQSAAEAARARAAAEALVGQANTRAEEAERRRAAAENQSGEYARLSESARAQVALLTRQVDQLRSEIARLSAALNLAETDAKDKDVQIANLGQRLNAALAARVEELQSYRSDFFGRLRRVLGDRADVRIVGDRFVFQSEVLFPVGSAELTAAGTQQIRDLAGVLLELSKQFPADLNWLLRVDGHADRSPMLRGGRFATNWELSAARAIAVAQLLIQEGLPNNRVAAAAFGDTQPLDDRDTPEAYARNRRIELRLTDR